MLAVVIRRLAQSVVALVVMSFIVFAGVYAIGNPLDILVPPDAATADIERARVALGLDRPLAVQYGLFLARAVTGDLGQSFAFNVPAIELVLERLPATLELAFAALLIAVTIGVPLGLVAGLRPHSIGARLIMAGSLVGFSLPTFWVGLVLIMVFAVELGWFPTSGRGGLAHLVLPAATLALFKLALLVRLTRAGTREALGQDYVRFARAKGLAESRVIGVHVLKNILVPIVTVTGLEFGSLVAFSIVTETIFSWPGMGKLLIDSIGTLDRPVIVAYLCVVMLLFVLINLVVDLAYAALDPRVRDERPGIGDQT